jgi:hypothetical protein
MELELLTRDATLDDWSTQEYVDAYQELRRWDEEKQKFLLSLDKWVKLIGEPPSKGEWNRLDRGEVGWTRTLRNKLREVVGAPPLPLTVQETVATNVSPDAAIYRLGVGIGDQVVIVGDVGTGVSLFVNGDVRVSDTTGAPSVDVRARTLPRRKYFNPRLPVEYGPRVKASGKSVAELLDFALRMHEQQAWW